MQTKERRNIIILAASIAVLTTSTMIFFLGVNLQEKGAFPDIGEVFKKNNELRRKIDGTLAWVDIDSSTKLHPGDKLFTGANSQAELDILDGTKIGMSASTLLRVDPKATADGMTIQAGLGVLTTSLTGRMTKLTIQTANGKFDLKGTGTAIQVNGGEDKTTITALAGNITYSTTGKDGKPATQTLAPNQMLGVTRAGAVTVISMPAKLLSPTTGAEVVGKPGVPITFKWKNLLQNERKNLELSRASAFTNVFYKKDVTGLEEATVMLEAGTEPGTVYWRIVQPGKEEYFYAQSFEYKPLMAPVIYEPVALQNYPSVPATPEFSWQKLADFKYEGEVQQLEGGMAGAQKFAGPNATYIAKSLTRGKYQIRVRGMKNAQFTDWSEWRPFSVGEEVKGLELVAPKDLALSPFVNGEKQILFEWTGGVGQTQLQVAADPEFKTMVFEGVTEKSSMLWQPQVQGKFYWRVRASSSSKDLPARNFQVDEPRLASFSPKDNYNYYIKDQGFLDVHFTWKDVSLDDKYTFEMSDTPDFKRMLDSQEVTKPEFDMKLAKKDALFYWRVKTANQVGPPQRLSVHSTTVPTIDPLVRVKIQEDRTVFGGTTDRAPTQMGPDFVELFLPQNEHARSYKVEIMRDRAGKNMVLTKVLKAPLFRWNHPPVGEFFWRYSYRDQAGTQSVVSDPGRLVIEPKDKIIDNNFYKMPY